MAGGKRPGRPKNEAPSKVLELTVGHEMLAELEALVQLKYGKSPVEVVRYLVQRELDDLKRAKVLPSELP